MKIYDAQREINDHNNYTFYGNDPGEIYEILEEIYEIFEEHLQDPTQPSQQKIHSNK